MSLSTDEKKQIIRKLKEHTDVAIYAFEDALKKHTLSEEELLFLEKNIEIISVLKPVIKANRDGARARSKKRNQDHRDRAIDAENRAQELVEENLSLKQQIDKLLKQLIDFEQSPIYQLGERLTRALSLSGEDKVDALATEGLVDKDFHNGKIREIENMLDEIIKDKESTEEEYNRMISEFQERIDYIRKICDRSEEFIITNYGGDTWTYLVNH